MEATSDSWLWTFSEKTMPSGKTLLTTKVPGETADDPPEFELHLDVDAAKSATLGVSPKTGGPIARILGADGAPRVDLHPAQLYLPASASWEDLADHDPGELYLPDVHLFGADCSAEASPRTDPVANWAWPINVDRDLPYADFLASFEAYKVGVTGL